MIALCLAASGVAQGQVRGRVVMSGAERTGVLVSLVTGNGQIVNEALTSSRGDFRLEGVSLFSLRSDNPMYIVINEEGYLPYRQRILQSDLRSGGLIFTIYLEEDRSDASGTPEAQGAVDVRQLGAEIPDSALEAYLDGLEAADEGRDREARELLELAVQRAPDYYDAWVDLAALDLRLDRPDDARQAYLKAAEANPAGILAHTNLGILYYQQGDRELREGNPDALDAFALAREWLEKSVQLDPTSSGGGFYLGAVLYRLEEYDEAEDWLQRAVSMGGEHVAGARSMLINVYTRQKRYVAAHEQAALFLEEFPDAPEQETIERVKAQLEAALGI